VFESGAREHTAIAEVLQSPEFGSVPQAIAQAFEPGFLHAKEAIVAQVSEVGFFRQAQYATASQALEYAEYGYWHTTVAAV
jgi:hypothetical protein